MDFTYRCLRRISHSMINWFSLFAAVFWLFSAMPVSAAEEDGWPIGCTKGELNNPAPHLILTCVPPEAWNGVLVVYAHGYASPYRPLELPDVSFDNTDVPTELMSLGFAFATTSFHKNGYAVEQAGADINALVKHFKEEIFPSKVKKVLIVGGSEGGLITTMLVERYPKIYDGGLAMCGPVGGANLQIQYFGDFRAVFDVFFPGIFAFGVVDGIPDYPNEDAANFAEAQYTALIGQAFLAYPEQVEQLFAVTKVARNTEDPESDLYTALTLLGYNIFGFNDIISVAGGNPYGNFLRWYSGSNNDWLLNLHVERVRADFPARVYLNNYYKPTGKLKRPLILLHTTEDEVVPFWHEILYTFRVLSQGAGDQLTLLPVTRFGHCEFTVKEVLGSLALLAYKTGLTLTPTLQVYRDSIKTSLGQ
jgi:pimeloyl-ACP methyl ester carboxylesterase